MRVRYASRALAELNSILSDLSEARIRQASARIGRFPQSFQEVAERPGVRRVPLLRYPYLVFYKVISNEAVVLRVVHGARKEPWEDL